MSKCIAIVLSTLISYAIYFFEIIVELQSFECNMRCLLTKVIVLRCLLSENRYLNFGKPLALARVGGEIDLYRTEQNL